MRPPIAPRCCSTGTTAIAAGCRGGRRRASVPIRTGSGCPRSCCSRPASKRSGRILKNSSPAGRMSRRSDGPRSTTCCGCGPGSATTRGRVTCMPARWRCCATMAGCFRTAKKASRSLPGIGPYTAAAIAAIAFDRRTMPVDGNIERVVSRLYAVEDALPQAKPLIQQLAATLLGPARAGDEKSRAGDSAQALMDLGSVDLHAEEAGLRAVPAERRLRVARTWRPGELSAQGAEEDGNAAPGRGLHRHPRRRVAGAHAARKKACSAA